MLTRARCSLFLVVSLLCLTAAALPAQQTAADSARVLLDAARLLQQQGYPDLARELFRIAAARYPATAAGLEATRESARSR